MRRRQKRPSTVACVDRSCANGAVPQASGKMPRMLSMRNVKAQDLQGLSPEAVTALASQLLEHIESQARELGRKQQDIEAQQQLIDAKQQLIQRKDRDIAWRDAKLEKISFELARLKRWKFGAKSEAMTAEQRQLFQDTLLKTRPTWRPSSPRCRPRCPRRRLRPRRRANTPAARPCLGTCAASSTITSPRVRTAQHRTAASR